MLLALAGVGLLAACGGLSSGFKAFNLATPKEACVLNSSKGIYEMNLSFNFLGTLKGAKFTFTPNNKTPVVANITDLANPPTGLRVDTLTAGEAKLYVDLNTLEPNVATQAIPKPDVKQVFPMDVTVDATGSDGHTDTLTVRGIDVAKCYP